MPVADSTVAGGLVADALADVHALLEHEASWTPQADAVDAAGARIRDTGDIRARAVRRSLLGAVESVTARLELQVAVVYALRDALAHAGERYAREHGERCSPLYFMSLAHFNAASTHAEVLALVTAARTVAATRRWPCGWGPVSAIPDRRWTVEEDGDVCDELQGIEMFFESRPWAGQCSSTLSMIDAVAHRETALIAASSAHGWRPPFRTRMAARASARVRKVRRCVQALLGSPLVRCDDDLPF